MLTVDNVETAGWGPALRGMRNPLNSWDRADSLFDVEVENTLSDPATGEVVSSESVYKPVVIGPNDESLMRRLIGQGSSDHRKFMRMLTIYCDVTAPLYWWKEASTYRVGTVTNSCSTMHTIMRDKFTEDMFSWERVNGDPEWKADVIHDLNHTRDWYLDALTGGEEGEAEGIWYSLIQKLPSSWNQRRTWMLNYEVMANIYRARRHHKLDEWHQFIDAMVDELPYPWIFTGEGC